MKIIISKELKKFMRYAKQITEIEGKETGFFIHYFNLPGHIAPYDIFHSELIIGDDKCIYLHSKYKRLVKSLEGKIIICGSFHIHSHKKYLDNYASSKMVDENRLEHIKECCRNYLSFDDLKTILSGIMKRDSKCMITCVLSDIGDHVSYYIPKKHVSIDEFTSIYNRFKKDLQPSIYTKTIYAQDGPITTLEYKRKYEYVFNLFDENIFDLHSGETIIDI